MATEPTPILPGVFDVHIDSQFTLDGDTAELDAYAIDANGRTAFGTRYAQLTVTYTGPTLALFVDTRNEQLVESLPEELQSALRALIEEATDHQQRGRTLIEP